MCTQPYFACANLACKGYARTLELVPCKNRPNCEIVHTRLRRPRSTEAYCPDCRVFTKRQRKNQRNRLYLAKKKARIGSAKALKGKSIRAENRGHVGVEQHGESSTMAASRNAVGGEVFSNSDDPFSGLGEADLFSVPYLLSEDERFLLSSLETFLHNQRVSDFSRSNVPNTLHNQLVSDSSQPNVPGTLHNQRLSDSSQPNVPRTTTASDTPANAAGDNRLVDYPEGHYPDS